MDHALGDLRVGTCSWTDQTMVKAWYPPSLKTAADKLRYYSARFDTVEVDSTFYGLPTPNVARLWAERTPPGFIFHVKAFAMMTRHGVKPPQLPGALRRDHEFTLDRQGRIIHPSKDVRQAVFDLFLEGVEPLRAADKLGLVLLQFPPYFVAAPENRDYIAWAVRALAVCRVAVEFRHASWVLPDELPSTLSHLSSLGASYVCVDEPVMPGLSVLPRVTASTSETAYVRFHGRNAATWHARSGSAAERFKYLYTEDELAGWVEPIRQLRKEASTTFVMFNNCYGDYAPRNAQQMMALLDSSAIPPYQAGTAPADRL